MKMGNAFEAAMRLAISNYTNVRKDNYDTLDVIVKSINKDEMIIEATSDNDVVSANTLKEIEAMLAGSDSYGLCEDEGRLVKKDPTKEDREFVRMMFGREVYPTYTLTVKFDHD